MVVEVPIQPVAAAAAAPPVNGFHWTVWLMFIVYIFILFIAAEILSTLFVCSFEFGLRLNDNATTICYAHDPLFVGVMGQIVWAWSRVFRTNVSDEMASKRANEMFERYWNTTWPAHYRYIRWKWNRMSKCENQLTGESCSDVLWLFFVALHVLFFLAYPIMGCYLRSHWFFVSWFIHHFFPDLLLLLIRVSVES